MRLVLPEPVRGGDLPVEIAPGVSVGVERAVPLPLDRAGWRARRLAGVDIVASERTETESGWPVTLVRAAGALYAFYELLDRGAVAVAVARDPAALEPQLGRLRSLLLAADIDRRPRDVVALSQLWESA